MMGGKKIKGFPGVASGKEPTCLCRRLKDMGLIPGSGSFPGGGYDNLEYMTTTIFFYGESHRQTMPGGLTVHRVAKGQAQRKRLSTAHS